MSVDWEEERNPKRDRTARLMRVARILRAHGERGIHVDELAKQVGMSTRTVRRDIAALETELQMPVFGEQGRFGIEGDAFLPPLRLTLQEAMAIFIAARMLTRYANKYDPALAAAYEKLAEGLPSALRDHVMRTASVLAERRVDERFNRHVADLTRAWADRRLVTLRYAPAQYDELGERKPRQARVRPYLLQPSLDTHALYLIGWDETRDGLRTFKVERILDLTVSGETFAAPDAGELEATLLRAWDIIADQPETDVVLRFAPKVAARVREATWHPTQVVEEAPDGSLMWRGRVAGTIEIRLWILSWGADVEVLEPAALRADVVDTLRRALARYGEGA